ncbi:MAG: polyphosphate polymerase domain-containing protein [Candidatus Komeilibacteria bacterium]
MDSIIPPNHFRRYEFKYQLPRGTAEKIMPELRDYMVWDPFSELCPTKDYLISSLYLDNIGKACYFEKLAGLNYRKKLRLRFYEPTISDTTPIYLEIKRRLGMVILKDRLRLTADEARGLLKRRGYQALQQRLKPEQRAVLEEFVWLKEYNSMQPELIVSYRRKALQGKVLKDFRVTFDSDICAASARDLDSTRTAMKPLYPGLIILEVKYNNIVPAWFYAIIQKYKLTALPYSKYCYSVERTQAVNRLETYSSRP